MVRRHVIASRTSWVASRPLGMAAWNSGSIRSSCCPSVLGLLDFPAVLVGAAALCCGALRQVPSHGYAAPFSVTPNWR